MICPRCNSQIQDNLLFCPVCGDWCAVNQQNARIEQRKYQGKVIAHNSLKSPLFLAMTILMTAVSIFYLIGCFTVSPLTGRLTFNLNITLIFTILASIFGWIAYSSTDINLTGKHLRRIAIFDTSQFIITIVAASLIGLGVLLIIVGLAIGGAIAPDFIGLFEEAFAEAFGSTAGLESIEDLITASIGILIAIISIACIIATAILIWVCFIHGGRNRFLKEASRSLDAGFFQTTKRAPYGGVLAYSILSLTGSLFSVIGALASPGANWFSILGAISLNVYLIVSAVWMSKLYESEYANNRMVQDEIALLNNIYAASQNAIATQQAAVYRPTNNNVIQ